MERNLYKNKLGDKLVFEESNLDLGLTYRYAWRFSDRYGLVKTAWLTNDGEEPCQISPAGWIAEHPSMRDNNRRTEHFQQSY